MLQRDRFKPRLGPLCLSIAAALGLAACGLFGGGASPLEGAAASPALVLTDTPELALYAELFNASQSRYRLSVRWEADLEAALREGGSRPCLVVGRYLKSAALRQRFQALDYLFGELTLNQAAFYPELLAYGSSGDRQLLIPLSFNLPAIVFPSGGSAGGAELSGVKAKATLGLKDLAGPAAAFNKKEGAAYVRMGFSPRWDPDFLLLAADSGGAAFREGRPLSWSEGGLKASVEALASWSASANGEASLEEDFQFKYLYTPANKYLAEGRALFAHLGSAELFLLPEEKRAGLDYRWFAEGGKIPVDPEIVAAGIPRSGRDKAAAEAFLKWFCREESQKAMLESARRTRSIEGSFGIAEGFSSVRSVTERLFPLYYPALVGHLPPPEALAAPAALPAAWPELKAKVLGPWLLEATARRAKGPDAAKPGTELQARLADYAKNGGD